MLLIKIVVSFVGVLVDAMRKGYWIILDELNLAPSDVLEALNRVLSEQYFSCSPTSVHLCFSSE